MNGATSVVASDCTEDVVACAAGEPQSDLDNAIDILGIIEVDRMRMLGYPALAIAELAAQKSQLTELRGVIKDASLREKYWQQ